ncbi:MAG: SusC/RagA family TonB-linked outer membrane protein [Bacteroidota bacterium]
MTKRYSISNILFLMIVLLFTGALFQPVNAQASEVEVTGTVVESGSGMPLAQVAIFVTSTGTSSDTDEQGAFTIMVPGLDAEISVNLPGYNKRNIFLNGRDQVEVTLVSSTYRSMDDSYNTPLGPSVVKDATYAATTLTKSETDLSNATSFDQVLQGRVPGMSVIEQSGMPGHRTFMNIRGFSSLFANTEPLLFIDGMIHDYTYASNSHMEGYALNPLDVVDIEDISDITILKDGLSYLGSAGSNGAIYVNTEQKAEASTVIKVAASGGITMAPKKQSMLTAPQFERYFEEVLDAQGYDAGQIDAMYPWLNGDASSEGYYRYNNSTDWQDEIFRAATVAKAHFFLKGGDDIATYNVSTGYLAHNGIYDNARYTRFNLRINGKVNITNRFSITPNVKLSLADSRVANHGPSEWKNPILSTALKPSIMDPIARDAATGEYLPYFDDVGVFGVSNPSAMVANALGENRNSHFLSSLRADYRFNDHFNLSTLWGINFNNAQEKIFLPDLGMVQPPTDSAYNSSGVFINEMRSTQNHTTLTYTNKTVSGHAIVVNGGIRYLQNSYKYNLSQDLNTPSDDFRALGHGSQYSFLRYTLGDNRELVWVSWFGDMKYNMRNKYFLSANLSYDGSSVTNQQNRYNLYPSLGAAWRLSSESFLNQTQWLEDLKLRASYSVTGNMFSTIYDYSKLYYTDRRIDQTGVLTREAIPNEDLELEKKGTINAGLDLSLLRQLFNVHVDYFISNVNNLVIQQELPASFGYNIYYDNGGQLQTSGVEVAADARIQTGAFVWTIGGSVTKAATTVKNLEFLNPATEHIITSIPGAEFITSEGNPVNAFYGYKTDGIISEAEAGSVIGPKGLPMQAGDVKYVGDKTIIGNPNPDLFGAVFTGLSFRNFELSAHFTYSVGNDVYNYMRYKTESMDSYSNQSATVMERWTPSNTGADMPRASIGDPTGNTVFSDRWIEDGSYLRLDQLTLSYYLPSIAGLFQGVVLYATATNLFTFTKYSGYDPEFIYLNSPFYMGIDYGKMPQTTSFIAGIKLDL